MIDEKDKQETSLILSLIGLCCSRLFVCLAIQNYSALIPILQKEWTMSGAAAGSIVSAYQVGFLVSLVGLSSLTDWVSAKKVYVYSCVGSAITSLLFAFFARGYLSAFILRGLLGLAVGGTYTPGLKLISESFPGSQRGRAMGFFIGGGSAGLAGSLAVTGWTTARYGWQTSFLVTAIGPVLGAVIASAVLKRMREKISEPEERKFKKEIFANKPALLMIGSYSAHVWELEGMRAWTPAFLVACFLATGLGTENAVQTAAGISSMIFIVGVFSTGIAGYLSDRLGRTTIIIAAMAISITCSFFFGWLIGGWIGWVIILGLVYGFAIIAESPVFSTGLSEVVSPKLLGTALGFRSLVGFGVGSIVPTVFGAILDLTNQTGTKESLGYLPTWGWALVL